MGWSLHFGRLFADHDPIYNRHNASWLFVGPDGSQHNFYEKLHPTEPEVAGVFYTLDGTYLRLDRRGASPTIESPDGLVRTFSLADGRYRLTEIEDRFGNWMQVAYTATTWTITDSHGRNHVLTLNGNGQVTQVDLDAFSRATTPASAIYTFGYTTASIERHRFDREPCDFDASHTENQTGQLLTSLDQPDGTGYEFTYSTNDSTFGSFSGAIRSAELPTGGRIEWDYATYGFKSQAPTVQESVKTQQRGVGARRTYLVDATGDHLQGSWTYDYIEGYQVTPPSGPFQVSCWHRMRVSDNVSSTVTESYFATAGGADNWWYGLPYAPCDPLTSSTVFTPWSAGNGTPYLSTRVYERQSNGTLKPIRSTYVIYDSDGPDSGPRQDRNHRLRYQKVVYHDDPDGSGNAHWEATANSDFDGLGHYRSVSRSSSFGPTKTGTTAYLPSGTYQLHPDSGAVLADSFTVPSVSAPWINGLSSGSTTTQGSAVSKRKPASTPPPALCRGSGSWPGPTRPDATCWSPSSSAKTRTAIAASWSAERLYGGDDLQNSPTGNLCDLNLDDETPAFVKLSSYRYGEHHRAVPGSSRATKVPRCWSRPRQRSTSAPVCRNRSWRPTASASASTTTRWAGCSPRCPTKAPRGCINTSRVAPSRATRSITARRAISAFCDAELAAGPTATGSTTAWADWPARPSPFPPPAAATRPRAAKTRSTAWAARRKSGPGTMPTRPSSATSTPSAAPAPSRPQGSYRDQAELQRRADQEPAR